MTSVVATKVDTVVIGAGVIGLAVARALSARNNTEVLLLDRASSIGSETSSRNSEVVHAGLYYPPTTNKARWCVRGKKLLYTYCHNHQIPHRICGKVVVATTDQQWSVLEHLHQQAKTNGVETLLLTDTAAVLDYEPTLAPTIIGGLYSPTTGIIDSHALMLQLLADAERNSNNFGLALHTCVNGGAIATSEERILIRTVTTDTNASDEDNDNEAMWLSCRCVINCAGLWADHVARLLHNQTIDPPNDHQWQPPQQYFAKGTYFVALHQQPNFSHLVYPVPDPSGGGLGVHATLDLHNRIKFGPDVEWLMPPVLNPDIDIDWRPDPNRAIAFAESIHAYWPGLIELSPDFVGVRPKLHHPSISSTTSGGYHDFVAAGPETHGVPNLIHLFGIESPGLTSCLAIAEHVASMLLDGHQ